MRWDEHSWDNYGPAHVGEVRAAARADGTIVAYEYQGWQHGWSNVETSEQLALGKPGAEWPGGAAQQVSTLNCGGMYDIPNLRLVNHKLPVLEYFKGGWLRSPLDLSFSFASEQAIDQLAFLAAIDPYEFRQRNIKDPRWLGVLEPPRAAAETSRPPRVSQRSSPDAASESARTSPPTARPSPKSRSTRKPARWSPSTSTEPSTPVRW
jgi:CO/xanthine dehydrogenase Mo-binding subunit